MCSSFVCILCLMIVSDCVRMTLSERTAIDDHCSRVIVAPQLGHLIWVHGAPRGWDAVFPQFGQTQFPPVPMLNPPMRPRPWL